MRVVLLVSFVAVAGCGKVLEVPGDGQDQIDADPCATAACECTVATQDTDCGAHEICDDTGAGRTCACAPAYKLVGSACVFDSAPLDKGFADPTKWTSVGMGATIDPAAAGNLDSGEGVINRLGMCQLSGFKQTFAMPPIKRAEPFKVSITTTAVDPMFEFFGGQASIGINGQFFDPLITRNAYKTDTFCLGPAAYGPDPVGGDVEFRIGSLGGVNCMSTAMSQVHIDQVAISVAAPGECPPPNTVVNGNFEAAGDWAFPGIQQGAGALANGVGEAGTQGALLTGSNKCSEVFMNGLIAFPTAATLPNMAIDMFIKGTPGDRLTMQIATKNVATINTNGNNQHKTICVPSWAQGTTAQLGYFMQRKSDNGCTTPLSRSFAIDNIKLVSDAACAGAVLDDFGFERAANVSGPVSEWGLTNGYVNDNEGSTAFITNVASVAHTGNGALRLGGANECVIVGEGGADFSLIVPPASGTAGPAVKFFANVGAANAKTTTRVLLLPPVGGGILFDLPENGTYTQRTFCLPPNSVGRRVSIRFSTGDSDGGGCTANYPEEVAFIDDIEVTTDASCPAQ